MSEYELEDAMSAYATLNSEIRLLERKKDELKIQIQTVLTIKELDRYDTDDLKLTWKEQKRKSLDKETLNAFLLTHDKAIENFQTETSSKVLRITRKEEKDNE